MRLPLLLFSQCFDFVVAHLLGEVVHLCLLFLHPFFEGKYLRGDGCLFRFIRSLGVGLAQAGQFCPCVFLFLFQIVQSLPGLPGFRASELVPAVEAILPGGSRRAEVEAGMREVKELLSPNSSSAGRQAAEACYSVLAR